MFADFAHVDRQELEWASTSDQHGTFFLPFSCFAPGVRMVYVRSPRVRRRRSREMPHLAVRRVRMYAVVLFSSSGSSEDRGGGGGGEEEGLVLAQKQRGGRGGDGMGWDGWGGMEWGGGKEERKRGEKRGSMRSFLALGRFGFGVGIYIYIS